MANIKDFTAPVLDLRPTEIGVEARAATGRRIGAFYNQSANAMERLGQRAGSALRDAGDAYVKYEDHREISAGAAKGARIIEGLNDQWAETAKGADPSDPSVAGKFRDEVLEPTLQKFSESFTTERSQQWAEHFVDQYRQHMFHKTSADMSSAAADSIHMNWLESANRLGNAVYKDPSYLEDARNTMKLSAEGVIGTSPTLSAEDARRVNKELSYKTEQHLVNSAIQGAIAKGGDWRKIADDPKNAQYIDQTAIDRYVREQRQEERLRNQEERSARADQEHKARLDFNTQLNKLEAETFPKKPGDQPQLPDDYFDRLRALRPHPGAALEPGRLKAMGDQGEAISRRLDKPEPRQAVSSASWLDFMREMRNPDLDHEATKSKIVEAYGDGRLTRADYSNLRQELEGLRTPEGSALMQEHKRFFSKYETTVDPATGMGLKSPLGQQNLYRAETDALAKARTLMREGKDWRAVYTPGNPEFFGNPDNLTKYQSSMQEEMRDRLNRLKSPALGTPNEPHKVLSAPVKVKTQEEANKLNPGTRYVTPDGKIFLR